MFIRSPDGLDRERGEAEVGVEVAFFSFGIVWSMFTKQRSSGRAFEGRWFGFSTPCAQSDLDRKCGATSFVML